MSRKRRRKGKSWQLLIVTEDGYGKRTPLRGIPRQKRGGQGVRITAKSKTIADATLVFAEDEALIDEGLGT
jgi:DNA gyrase/topoisomerase IV subunit A